MNKYTTDRNIRRSRRRKRANEEHIELIFETLCVIIIFAVVCWGTARAF